MINIALILTLVFNADLLNSDIYEFKTDTDTSIVKIILFTTSMSCECTLKMCAEYEQELQKVKKYHNEKIHLEIIDSYADEKLYNQYKILFVPTIIFLNKENMEMERIEREDDIEIKLNNILKTLGEKNDN